MSINLVNFTYAENKNQAKKLRQQLHVPASQSGKGIAAL
jgi:hypothetical protein